MRFRDLMLWAGVAALGTVAMPAAAQQQMTTIDPNSAIDSDLNTPPPAQDPYAAPAQSAPVDQPPAYPDPAYAPPAATGPAIEARTAARNEAGSAQTFRRDELIGAAEGVFGKGASGLSGIIEDILKDQGEPNAYIAGSEAAGALGVGLRYGAGRIFHKVEGERKVYWTGPSIGFDVGGDANKVFVLVYNLYDSQELYKRYPQGEGRVYFVGGFSAAYLRRGDVVLIPVKLGVGWRVGVNAGYMKFSEKRRILPF
jgi:hypothetical protein